MRFHNPKRIAPIIIFSVLSVAVVFLLDILAVNYWLRSLIKIVVFGSCVFACAKPNLKSIFTPKKDKSVLISIFIGLGVIGIVWGGYFILSKFFDFGTVAGGAANLAAVKQMVGLSTENFVMLSTCNLIVSFFYLMFLMGGGVTFARKIVGRVNHVEQEVEIDNSNDNPYRDFATKASIIQLLKVFVASVVIMGISVVVGKYAGGESGISMVALILTITTLSLLMTASKQVRSWDKSYDAGMYLIYVFCLVMATMADLSTINWEQSVFVLMFQTVIVFGSLFITIFLARPLRIDADTAVITSNTLVNSPVCVPMIAATMKNRDVVVVGITNGLAGYAVGNYLGYLIYQLLSAL